MLFRPLFATVYIGVNFDSSTCSVKVRKKRANVISGNTQNEFKIVNYELSMDAIKAIKKIKNRHAFSYLCILSKSINEILIPYNNKTKFPSFGVNEKEFKLLKYQNCFIALKKSEIDKYDLKFQKSLGLDFIFSAYILLHNLALEHKLLESNLSVFILQEKESLNLIVASKKGIFYGDYLSLIGGAGVSFKQDEEEKKEHLAPKESIGDNLGLDDLDELGELEGLDSELEDLDSLDFDFKDDAGGDEGTQSLESLQDLAKAGSILSLVQESIKRFYESSLYEADFIQKIVFFDTYGMQSQTRFHIESNILLTCQFKEINILDEIINLAKKQDL